MKRKKKMCLPVEECISKRVQLPKRFFGVNYQGIAGHNAFCTAVHHRDERICCGFRADPHSGKILLQQVAVGEMVGYGVKQNSTRDTMLMKGPNP